TDLAARVVDQYEEPLDIAVGSEPALDRLEEVFTRLLYRVDHPDTPVWGAGGSAGPAGGSSPPAGRSRRRSCPAGTATRSATGWPHATTCRYGSTTRSTSWHSGSGAAGLPRANRTSSTSRSVLA